MTNAEYMREYRRKNSDRQREWWSEYRDRPDVRARRTISLRNSHLKRMFGITLEQFDMMLQNQGGVCNGCGGLPDSKHGFHVDHCHQTGIIRGILCHGCNTALGLVRESPDRLRGLAEYLEKSHARSNSDERTQ